MYLNSIGFILICILVPLGAVVTACILSILELR